MNVAEATRQYQATLEARRSLETATEGLYSFDAELEVAAQELTKAEAAMIVAWLDGLVQ